MSYIKVPVSSDRYYIIAFKDYRICKEEVRRITIKMLTVVICRQNAFYFWCSVKL